jgi:predicted dehydrogenase
MKRIAVVGAGGMARVRTRALLATGGVGICGVASRHLATARKLGDEVGCPPEACFEDFRRLPETRPDAILVEVPHQAQDSIVLWALEQGLPVLVGGTLATTTATAQAIRQLSESRQLPVEAGFEARYSPAWEYAKRLVDAGELGRLIAIRTLALWAGDPHTWYYHQEASGGMPLTHMTYCFINPVRWIAGEVRCVSAFASRVLHTAPELVAEESCVANLLFDRGVLCSMTAGYVAPPGLPAWSATFLGTAGAVEVRPNEGGTGAVTVYRGGTAQQLDFRGEPSAFVLQAKAFVAALDGAYGVCRNPPAGTVGDVQVAEAIVLSAREQRTVSL